MMTANRVTFITLAVRDLARSRAYYEALGWEVQSATDDVAFYAMRGMKFALFSLEGLARETGLDVSQLKTGAMTLAQNQPSQAGVDAAFAKAIDCGASSVAKPFETDWGGYSCYVADPDGHLWEFAHNPFSALDEDGHLA